MKLYPLLRIKELAPLLGLTPDRNTCLKLIRDIQAREGYLGVTILQKGPLPNSAFTTTIPLLRQHMPELFDRKDEGIEFLRTEIKKYEEAFSELRSRDNALAASIRRLKNDLEILKS